MKAVRRFDPERGVRLVSFALHWIRAEIHEYILRNWRLVKVATTKAQRKLFFNLRSMKKSSAQPVARRARAIANELGVKPEEVVEMETRLSGRDIALDPTTSDDDGAAVSPIDWLTDREDEPAQILEREETAETDPSIFRARSRSSTTAAAGSSKRAGCAKKILRRCRTWPPSMAYPPSGSARSKARR